MELSDLADIKQSDPATGEVHEISFNGRSTRFNEVLKQEEARREAAVKNMLRLKALRMARDAKLKKE
jgi:hypothetical protein